MVERKRKWVDPDKAFVIHPDMQDALMNYDGTGRTIREVFDERDRRVADGETYHNDLHDEEMLETAEERTKLAAAKGWKYPKRR